MQELALKRLQSVDISGSFEWWPTQDILIERILKTPEYYAARDLHVDNLPHIIVEVVKHHIFVIQNKWMETALHKCLSFDEAKKSIAKCCENGVVPDGYISSSQLVIDYYMNLERKIYETLIEAGTTFDDYELEIMIPFIHSPFFDRERIKETFYHRNNKI